MVNQNSLEKCHSKQPRIKSCLDGIEAERGDTRLVYAFNGQYIVPQEGTRDLHLCTRRIFTKESRYPRGLLRAPSLSDKERDADVHWSCSPLHFS